jgi:hypothetical protein
VVFDLGGVLIDWDPRYLYRKLFRGDETAIEHFLRPSALTSGTVPKTPAAASPKARACSNGNIPTRRN